MESLLDLEFDADPPRCRAGPEDVSAAGAVSPATKRPQVFETPPLKRSRSGLLGSTGKHGDRLAPMPFAKVELDALASPSSIVDASAIPDDDQTVETKVCAGCDRSPLTGRCWIEEGEKVVWSLPESRGLWCRDCFNIWRLNFRDRMPLATMHHHLQSNPSVISEWDIAKVAYISLRRAGSDRISSPQLTDRMQLIRWILKSFGVPLFAFAVRPVSEVQGVQSPLHLVPMLCAGALQTGAFVQTDAPVEAMKILLPQDPEAVQLMSRRFLMSERGADAAKISELFGVAAGSMVARAGKPKADAEVVTAELTKSAKRVQQKVRSAISGAALILDSFKGDEWETMKEASFTGCLSKLLDAKLASAHEQVESLIQESCQWYDGMASCKLFIKQCRDAERSKGSSRVAKLGAMDELIGTVDRFLRAHLTPATSFVLLRLKCKFLFERPDGEARPMHMRVQDMMSVGMPSALEALDASGLGQAKADGFVRSMFMESLAGIIRDMSSDDVEVARPLLAEDMEKSIALLAKCSPSKDALADVMADLEKWRLILLAGTGGTTKVSAILAAEKYIMTTPKMAVLTEVLKSTDAGQEFLAPIRQLRATSANDDLAEQRFCIGMECFADEAMLRLQFRAPLPDDDDEEASASVVLYNTDHALATPMLVETMLVDAMSNILASIKLWSQTQVEGNASRILQFLQKVSATINIAELTLVAELFAAFREGLNAVLDWNPEQPIGSLEKAIAALRIGAQSAPTTATTSLIAKFQNMGAAMKSTELVEFIAKHARIAQTNNDTHKKLSAVLHTMKEMAAYGLPANPDDAIDQWTAKGNESCIAVCIELMKRVEELGDDATFNFDEAFNVEGDNEFPAFARLVRHSVFDDSSKDSSVIMLGELVALPSLPSRSSFMVFARDTVIKSAGALVRNFACMVELESIVRSHEVDPATAKGLGEFVGCFVDKQMLMPSVTALTKVIASDSLSLPSVGALGLLADIVKTGGVERIPVGTSMVVRALELPSSAVMSICELYMKLHHIATAFAWIGLNCDGPHGCTAKHILRTDLDGTLDLMETSLVEADDLVIQHEDKWHLFEKHGAALLLPRVECVAWLGKVRDHWPTLCRLVTSSVATSIDALSKLVRAHTPAYDHFLSDTQCSMKLAKSRLITWSSKDMLTEESVSLFKALASLGKFREKHGLSDDDEHSELIAEGRAAFSASKKVMFISKAVAAMTDLSGPAQVTECKKWAAHESIPKGLCAELLKFLGKKGVTVVKTATTSATKTTATGGGSASSSSGGDAMVVKDCTT